MGKHFTRYTLIKYQLSVISYQLAVYLASLAIVDLVFLPVSLYMDVSGCFGDRSWWCTAAYYVFQSSATVEPLLVLSFSVERLIAILRPFRVCL